MTLTVQYSTEELAKTVKRTAIGLLMFATVCVLAHCGSGCTPAESPKEAEYTAAIVACAATAKTKADDHMCRVTVNHQFGICGSPAELPGDCS